MRVEGSLLIGALPLEGKVNGKGVARRNLELREALHCPAADFQLGTVSILQIADLKPCIELQRAIVGHSEFVL